MAKAKAILPKLRKTTTLRTKVRSLKKGGRFIQTLRRETNKVKFVVTVIEEITVNLKSLLC